MPWGERACAPLTCVPQLLSLCAPEPGGHSYRGHALQLLKLVHFGACAPKEVTAIRSSHITTRVESCSPKLERCPHRNKDPAQPKKMQE